MRKVLISLAAAASAVVASTPAAAQFYGVVPSYQYGYSNYSHARAIKARIDYIQHDLRRLANRRMISAYEYHDLIRESHDLEWRLLRNARDGRGLSRREALEAERRISRLEQRIAWDVRDGRLWAYRW